MGIEDGGVADISVVEEVSSVDAVVPDMLDATMLDQPTVCCSMQDVLDMDMGMALGVIEAIREELKASGCDNRPHDLHCNVYRNMTDALEDSVVVRAELCPQDIQDAVRAKLRLQ